MAWYVDSSAFLKLVCDEPDAEAFRTWIDADPGPMLVSSDLLTTEALRAARRLGSDVMELTRSKLAAVPLLVIDRPLFERASELDPAVLRSLDAIHLAAALTLGDELEGVVTYDVRLADAARVYGVEVLAPADATDADDGE